MIKLRAHGAAFKISAHSAADGEGWCAVDVEVETIGFNGKTIARLEIEGLKTFEKELEAMMRNIGKDLQARLCSSEPDLYIELTVSRLGQIRGIFSLESERRADIPTVLSGSFTMDQTFLSPLRKQLADLMVALSDPKPEK